MGQLANIGEGLEMTNSLIEGILWQQSWKQKQLSWKMDQNSEYLGQLGQKFWKNFMKRNNNQINSQIPGNIAANRKQWSTYPNFAKCYDLVYDQMEKAEVTVKLPEPILMNEKGDIVFTVEEAYGLPVDLDLIHLDYNLFVDKVGNNTNMKDDGRVGAKKIVAGNKAQQKKQW